jgi:hypothetical protein
MFYLKMSLERNNTPPLRHGLYFSMKTPKKTFKANYSNFMRQNELL